MQKDKGNMNTSQILMLLAKGLGAFVYSIVHLGILILILFAISFLIAKIVSFSLIWIILIMLFLWGIVQGISKFVVFLLAIPYRFFARETVLALVLPVFVIVSCVVAFLIGIWEACYSSGFKGILCGLFLTYECLLLTWQTVIGMFMWRKD